MKIKTTAIALAVAGTCAAPIAAQAECSVYASARIGVEYIDTADVADFDIRSHSSRFGAKGETDLGNGLTGYGHYEWDVDEADFGIRHRYVGLKGDFGNVYVGHTYHAFYNHVVGPADPSYFRGGTMVDYNGRRDDFVTYASATGAVSWAASARMTSEAEEDEVDEIEIGVSFPIGDTTLGLGLHNTAADADAPATGFLIGNSSDEDVVGVMWSGIGIGDGAIALGFQAQDDDTSVVASFTMGGLYLIAEVLSIDADTQSNPPGADDTDITAITLGYEQTLGRQTKMIYEAHSSDNDCPSGVAVTVCDDVTALEVVLRYDII